MRVLLLSTLRLLRPLLDEVLPQYSLTIQAATLTEVLTARDDPSVLLHLEQWDAQAAGLVGQVSTWGRSIYVIVARSVPTTSYLAILQHGASDLSTVESIALHILAFKMGRQQPEVRYPFTGRLGGGKG